MPERMMCATCLRGLALSVVDGESVWEHEAGAHPVVPVPADARQVLVCDFCFVVVRACWTYWTKPFTVRFATPGGVTDVVQDELWAACEDCHGLIAADDEAGLVARSVRAQVSAGASTEERGLVEMMLTDFFVLFRANRVGDAVFG